MTPAFVLVHSPSVGPSTWSPVAHRLTALGHECRVPSLLSVADAPAPHWRRVVDLVGATLDGFAPQRPVVLVVHSNAGLFVPLLVSSAVRPVVAAVFVDAALPVPAGETPVAPPDLLESLRGMAVDDRLPQWTDWWADSDVAPMFPDPTTRAAISAEQPRLPFEYYTRPVPAPAGWDSVPCGYVLFGPPYDAVAAQARERGWPVELVPGLHLHMIVDPDRVADRILALAASLTSGPAPTS